MATRDDLPLVLSVAAILLAGASLVILVFTAPDPGSARAVELDYQTRCELPVTAER